MAVDLRDGTRRFVTRAEGRTTSHSFSFGEHYDPANVGFGLLAAHNDELLPPGTGYPDHPHADVEIVTVVLSGALRHSSAVGSGVLGPGDVQRLSAGAGVVHSEVSDASGPTRFVQTWLRPDEPGGEPAYASAPGVWTPDPDSEDGLVPLAGGDAAIGIGATATLLGGSLRTAASAELPDAPWVHVFVVEGRLRLGGARLGPADAARLSDEDGRSLTALTDSRFLVWSG